MTRTVLVAGAAGRVGRLVARRLADRGITVRRLLRTMPADGMPGRHGSLVGDFNDATCMAGAFAGTDAAFLYAPAPGAGKAVMQAARQAGVRHVVLLSSASVTKAPPGVNPIAERHREAEGALQSAGLAWTFVRPDTMASNCLQWAPDIRQQARVYTAYPESLRCPVHEDDIALLAVESLLDDRHQGHAYDITGPELLSIREQVQCIARHLGTGVQCVAIPDAQAVARMLSSSPGLTPTGAARLLDYLRRSVTAPPHLSDDFRRAIGQTPRRFDDWVGENLAAFQAAPTAPRAPPRREVGT
jgi:uncharacterized protein YbjT (DUF2867 family)